MAKDGGGEWYAEGLRFECTQCGMCCTGPPGLVEFTGEEGRAMAEYLAMTRREFFDRFACELDDDGWALQEVPAPDPSQGFDCVLLDRDPVTGATSCRVHPYRPAQCRTFPFWPEYLRTPRTWKRAARRCEGIGKGPLVSIEQIREDRDETPRV